MGVISKMNHFSHEHELVLKDPKEPYECDGCKKPGFGLYYVCPHQECNFCLHQQCATASSSAHHPFFSHCNLKFHPRAPQFGGRYCDACGKDILGFVYQCTHSRPHDFHPCCLKLPHTITEDGVTIHLKEKLTSKCLKCNSKKAGNGIRGWCYASSSNCYHVACVEDLMMENWKKKKSSKTTTMATRSSIVELQGFNPTREVARPSVAQSSTRTSKLWKMAKTMMLIVTAIFGEPTSLLIALSQLLFSS